MAVNLRQGSAREDLFESFAKHLNPGRARAYRELGLDVVMGRREGVWFWDALGERRWFNAHCNGGVFNLGHRHPRVLAAVHDALEALDVGNHHLVSIHRVRLAERLAATTDGALPGVVFGVSGGEAVDLAIKCARAATGRRGVVSALGGYHGHTGLALAAGDAAYRTPVCSDLPEFRQVPFDDLDALDDAVGATTAAVLLEPIPATLGMPIPSPGYLQAVRQMCRDRGAKLLLDEVQTGLGRTGQMWCWQHEGVTPDALVTGKGLSGGIYPITATLLSAELHALFEREPFVHVSTFGGAEPGCAAALAVLDIIEEDGFLARVDSVAQRFVDGFRAAPFELRHRGLMMGLALGGEGAGLVAAKGLFDSGVFAVYANNDTSVVQFLPPLTTSDDEADHVIERVRDCLG
jgi:acetylornithine/succinyldiaminopimelate/putrescine aminotransferase